MMIPLMEYPYQQESGSKLCHSLSEESLIIIRVENIPRNKFVLTMPLKVLFQKLKSAGKRDNLTKHRYL